MKIGNRRIGITRFIVPHESALWFARTIGLGVIATGGLLGLITWMHHRKMWESMVANGLVERPELIDQYARIALINGALVVVAGALFVILMSCFLLHRIAGPVYRLKCHMQSILDDLKVGELRLRDNDQLLDIATVYNQLLYKCDLIDPKPDDGSQAKSGHA